ncbi:hypothetical protein BCR34DRAFT_385934 [Clohesyomyces aquaticus]|uniref:Uncharacterized protein n=1 Tax=Clohesyomyces aquaticus TaxID=1231657 RepID=A0A1Y1ZFC0_9PLEO|nr:hypothetical protein BCR34DRAFT_385934 [Clohesyomyces aquaticus]
MDELDAAGLRGVVEWMEALSAPESGPIERMLGFEEGARGRNSSLERSNRPRADAADARGAPVERKRLTEALLPPLMWALKVEAGDEPVTSRLPLRSRGKRDVRVERRLSAEGLPLLLAEREPAVVSAVRALALSDLSRSDDGPVGTCWSLMRSVGCRWWPRAPLGDDVWVEGWEPREGVSVRGR